MTNQKTGCIYRIYNNVNGKSYVGQTVDFKRRMQEHFNGHSSCPALQHAIKKYGVESFNVDVIETDIPVSKLSEIEIFYIKELKSLAPSGYNMTTGGEGVNTSQKKRKVYKSQWKTKKFNDKQVAMSLRIDPKMKKRIEQIARKSKQSINAVINDVIIRGIKIRECKRNP